ncbi:MAG: triose-phosphate isomerase [Vampirovibrionales bacterium]
MTPRTPLIAGNWKMMKTRPQAQQFVADLAALCKQGCNAEVEWLICPPFTALASVETSITAANLPVKLGAQTMESQPEGAYTGEISAAMLVDAGVSYVILGHSERRQYYGETNATVAAKVQAAVAAGLTPIVCVGETLEQREAGVTDAIVIQQVTEGLALLQQEKGPLALAYEPVWAIGTGKTCEAPEANRVCGLIRETVASVLGTNVAQVTRVLYGGSVKPTNSGELFALSDIDGALIGGASLVASDFHAIGMSAKTSQACMA